MREKVIDRIIEIGERNNGFNPQTMRWKNARFKVVPLCDLQIGSTEYMNQFRDRKSVV